MQIIINISDEDYQKVRNCYKAIFADMYDFMRKTILDGEIIDNTQKENFTN